ncbi:MAG: minor capsid protein, partial [Actinobacteria bacterium]|nr:minor capsid protein [Actinomycetota bacterium]
LDEIAGYLATKGIGVVGTDIFQSQLPAAPDACVALYETGGFPPELHAAVDHPTFQVLCRAKDYAAARAKAEAVYAALHGLTETVLGGRRYLLIAAMQTPTGIGRDDNGRAEVSCNFRVMLENSTGLR